MKNLNESIGRITCTRMYGPPRGCKGKGKEEEKSAQMYSVFVEISSPGLDELRACPPF